MSDEPIAPALTPEEWRTWRDEGHVTRDGAMILHTKGIGFAGVPRISCLRHPMDVEAHAAAAVLLYEQSFGFTHEDVRDLQNAADHHKWVDSAEAARLERLWERLAALLPPVPSHL